jgi:hypothetical protein
MRMRKKILAACLLAFVAGVSAQEAANYSGK